MLSKVLFIFVLFLSSFQSFSSSVQVASSNSYSYLNEIWNFNTQRHENTLTRKDVTSFKGLKCGHVEVGKSTGLDSDESSLDLNVYEFFNDPEKAINLHVQLPPMPTSMKTIKLLSEKFVPTNFRAEYPNGDRAYSFKRYILDGACTYLEETNDENCPFFTTLNFIRIDLVFNGKKQLKAFSYLSGQKSVKSSYFIFGKQKLQKKWKLKKKYICKR